MAYFNGNKVFTVVSTTEAPVDVPNKQATTTIVVNALTNINGRLLTTYEATEQTIGGYECLQITKGGEIVTEAQAITYMQYMTGSKFLPKYNLDKPQYSLFIFADFTIWKPQFDDTNGLLLYKTGYKLATQNDIDAVVEALENGVLIPAKSLITTQIENISDESGTIQEIPFIIQGTGTANNTDSVDTSPVGKQLEKQGNTICYNQLAKELNSTNWFSSAGTTTFNDNIATYTASQQGGSLYSSVPLTIGHKYIIACSIKLTTATTNVVFRHQGAINDAILTTATTNWQTLIKVITVTSSSLTFQVLDNRSSNWDAIQVKNVICIDLTQWFNGDISQDLLDNPSHFSWYYNGDLTYNTGELVNCAGRYLICGGRNIYDSDETYNPVIPNRDYYYYGSASTTITYYDRDKNSLGTESVSANTTFTTPSNCAYINSNNTSNITISLYYTTGDGYNEYYPYVEPQVYDTGSEELLAFDKKTPDGTWHKNTGTQDLSQISYDHNYFGSNTFSHSFTNGKLGTTNLICDKYPVVAYSNLGSVDKGICFRNNSGTNILIIKDSSLQTTDTPTGTLQYELAVPTTEQGTQFSENIEIDDYGTMAWKDTNEDYVAIPQGVKIFYPADYVLFLDSLLLYANGSAENLALKDDLLPKLPSTSADGTYTLKATKSGDTITYSWVADQ